MLALSKYHEPVELHDRLRDAHAVTAALISDVIAETCRRLAPMRQSQGTAQIERLIGSGAWTDAALAMIDLELPQWRLRRIAYDEGEWHCALSQQRELPDWLDQTIEAHHVDLPLAILSAFVDAQAAGDPSNRTSVPAVSRHANPPYEPVCCDNFG